MGGVDKQRRVCYNASNKYGKEMQIMWKRQKVFANIMAIMLLICALFLSSCSLLKGKISDELPKEEVLKIERVTQDVVTGGEVRVVLSADKIEAFFEILDDLTYVRYYNIRGVKCIPFDEISYVITYETHTVYLKEHQFAVYKNEQVQNSIRFKSVSPMDKYNELSALFDE